MATGAQITSSWFRRRGFVAGNTSLFVKENGDGHAAIFSAFFFGVASNAVAGSSDVAFSTSGNLIGAGALSGNSSPAFTTAGIIQGLAPITGAATVAFTTSATGATVGALAGTSSVAFTTTGALVGTGLLSGTVTTAFSTAGALAGSTALTGSTSPAFTTSGAITGTGALSGTVTVAFATSGTLAGPGAGGAISGSAALAFTTEGNLTAAAVQSLHGRKVRGKRVYFPDELDPVIEAKAAQDAVAGIEVPTLPSLAPIAAQIEAAKQDAQALLTRIAAERKAKARQAAVAALTGEFEAALDVIEAIKVREAEIVRRLRDDDDFLLLAA